MSTSITLLDQNSNANNVDIMVFEPCVLFTPATAWGGGGNYTHGPKNFPMMKVPFTFAMARRIFQ